MENKESGFFIGEQAERQLNKVVVSAGKDFLKSVSLGLGVAVIGGGLLYGGNAIYELGSENIRNWDEASMTEFDGPKSTFVEHAPADPNFKGNATNPIASMLRK